jgi:pimeloyl-ACP methyl ester carboxylesterase
VNKEKIDRLLGEMVAGKISASDGTQLSYQSFGAGPAIVLANGIGVNHPGMALQIAALRHRYRLVCWDYRGIGDSRLVDAEADLSMPRHAQDALEILDHLDISEAIFLGWSMGVQVSLEVYRAAPDRMVGLVALLGTYGMPFRNTFPAVGKVADFSFDALARVPWLAHGLVNVAVAVPEFARQLLQRTTFIREETDADIFASNVRSVAGADKRNYLRTMKELSQHDASDLLPRVECPALIIAGDRDYLTPPKVAIHMADEIPDATYREVPTGSHFALIEQPDLINGWLQDFAGGIFPDQQSAVG